MAESKSGPVGDRTDWILRLLYAPVKGRTEVPIVGTTRLMKACFLAHKKLDSELDVDTDFAFYPGDYGPVDEQVYDAVERLVEQGLVERRDSREHEGTEFGLTPEGAERAAELFQSIPGDQRQLLSWLKGKHVLEPLSKLLSFVYNLYPDYAENSTLRE